MEIEKPKRKRQANPDRITLSSVALENLVKMEQQLKRAFGGMIKLKNKDLTNFLLEVRVSDLTNAELKLIKERYFDEVRAAQWALERLRAAKNAGEELTLTDVLAELKMPENLSKRRHERRKAQRKTGTSEAGSIAESPAEKI